MTTETSNEQPMTTPNNLAVYDRYFSRLEVLSSRAEKGPSHSLLAIGMFMMIIALTTKVKVGGMFIAELNTTEFVVSTFIGFLLMICAAALRLYIYTSQMQMEREWNRLGAELLRKSNDAAEDLIIDNNRPFQNPIL